MCLRILRIFAALTYPEQNKQEELKFSGGQSVCGEIELEKALVGSGLTFLTSHCPGALPSSNIQQS